jgi:hypothetical protein
MVAMNYKNILMMLAALALVSAAGCVSGPSPRAIVKTELDSAFAYPGMRAFPGLYEIVSIDIVRKHSVNPNTYDVEADVKVRLLKDVADWVKTDGVGGLGENGFAAYRRFRNGKVGDTFSERVQYRITENGEQWSGQRRDAT